MNKKETPHLGIPHEVHPGIKLCRWVCLIAGVFHGVEKLKRLKLYDAPLREQERIRNERRRENLAREKAIAGKAELAALTLLFLGDPAPVDHDTIQKSSETYDSTSQHESTDEVHPERSK